MTSDYSRMDDMVMNAKREIELFKQRYPHIKLEFYNDASLVKMSIGHYYTVISPFIPSLDLLINRAEKLRANVKSSMTPLYERQLEQSKWADDNSVVHSFKLIDEWTQTNKKHLIDVYNEQDQVLFTLMFGKEE